MAEEAPGTSLIHPERGLSDMITVTQRQGVPADKLHVSAAQNHTPH